MARRKIDPEVGRATQFQTGGKQAQTAKKAALHAQKTESDPAGVSRRHLGQVVRSPSQTSGVSGSVVMLGCFFPHDGQNFAPSGISSRQKERTHFMKKPSFPAA